MKVVIIGGGPCGLGAAWRLSELDHNNWQIFEKKNQWGGLSASFQDDDGFIWDVGGHVLFSHYNYFDNVMDTVLGSEDGWVFHEREAWVRMQERFIPYPIQSNIHRLPRDIFWECIKGIIDIHKNGHQSISANSGPANSGPANSGPANFGEWIDLSFGTGLAKWFLRPYNFKVWGFPVDQLDWSWVGDRVATVDLKKVIENYIYNKDSISWGPNSTFRFPLHGGTGAIWNEMARHLPDGHLHLNKKVDSISSKEKFVRLSDGSKQEYDVLLTTMPLTSLVKIADFDPPFDVPPKLKYSCSHIIGIAMTGNPPEHLSTKCWMYFPEDNCPFYRATVFSNYSPNNVPDINNYWSLMCEVSETEVKLVNPDTVVEDVIQGMINTGLIENKNCIHHTWYHVEKKGYPTPCLKRNLNIFPLHDHLMNHGIYSRGRFGSWRYEVGNMDHSFMQGVEFVNHIFFKKEELTVWKPGVVNNN